MDDDTRKVKRRETSHSREDTPVPLKTVSGEAKSQQQDYGAHGQDEHPEKISLEEKIICGEKHEDNHGKNQDSAC